jgi:outer membrane protein assembly factor BamE
MVRVYTHPRPRRPRASGVSESDELTLRISILTAILLCVLGCSRVRTLGDLPLVYRIDIQQGNVVTQEMLAQLQRGMDEKQVRFIMGTPVIHDTFHADRWDYLYIFDEKGEPTERRRITLVFVEGRLDRVEGDVQAASGPLAADTRSQDKTVDVPRGKPRTVLGRIADILAGDEEDSGQAADDKVAADPTYRDPTDPEVRN